MDVGVGVRPLKKVFREGGGGGGGVKREPIGSLPAVTKQNDLTGRKLRPISFIVVFFPRPQSCL